jgi:hypothetical protein
MTSDSSNAKNPISEAIDGAEELSTLLDNLIEMVATDSGAPFKPGALEGLAALKKSDTARFETLRGELKKAGCRVTALDKAIARESGDSGGHGPKQADVLITLAESAALFHAPDKTGYADLNINGHRETWPIRSKGFRRWLAHRFFEETQGAPNSEALQSALNVIEARADFDATERVVHVRVGELEGKYYLDLCNETWQAVEIDTQGWRIIDTPPVRFRRSPGMKPLPIPVRGASIKELKPFLNVKSDHDFVLVVAYLVAALRPRGPYPVIGLNGEQGSAKSTLCAILKALLDPNTAPLRALPREDRDLFIAANNGHVLVFDNVSGLSEWISDTLCRLSTGGSFAVRSLYTDQDEVLFDAVKPVILNGIEDIITRPDLADRALLLMLDQIPEERRRSEQELWAAFEIARPRILGALPGGVTRGLAMLPQVKLKKLPRMADFARWATACETVFWPGGTFEAAYNGNRDKAIEDVLDSDLVAATLRTFIVNRGQWTGTAAQLLADLGAVVGELETKSKEWPKTARAPSGRLRRMATFLRKVGIEIAFKKVGVRTIRICHQAAENGGTKPSEPSVSSASGLRPSGGNGLATHPSRTVGTNVDDRGADRASTVRANTVESNGMTAADGVDANFPRQSAQEKTAAPTWRKLL